MTIETLTIETFIMDAKEMVGYMESLQNEMQRRVLMRFFKTGPGEYGEGDEFLGLKVPQTREVVKAVWKDFPVEEVPELLRSRWHEVRLCGLLILVAKFEATSFFPSYEDLWLRIRLVSMLCDSFHLQLPTL